MWGILLLTLWGENCDNNKEVILEGNFTSSSSAETFQFQLVPPSLAAVQIYSEVHNGASMDLGHVSYLHRDTRDWPALESY